MRRRLKPAALAALAVVVLLVIWHAWRPNTVLRAGRALPGGAVAPKLVSAPDTGILLAPDGSLWAWGGSSHSLFHLLGTTNRTAIPRRVGSDSDWCRVAAGRSHAVALKMDGSLWYWGTLPGLVQPQSNAPSPVARRVGADNDWAEIAAGAAHLVGLKKDGSLWTWGQNRYGQLGHGGTNESVAPLRIGEWRWNTIEAGAFNTFAVRSDGTVWAWGLMISGGGTTDHDWSPRQLDPSTNWVALSASSYCLLALKDDGSLWLRGQNARFWTDPPGTATDVFVPIGTGKKWKQVYCGEMHFIGRASDDSWWGYGQNHDGQLGAGRSKDVLMIQTPRALPYDFDPWTMTLASERGNTLVLLKDGTLWSSGIRLGGETPSTRFNGIKASVNRFTHRLPGSPYFPIRQFQCDTVPTKIWTLPPEVVRALGGTNANAK